MTPKPWFLSTTDKNTLRVIGESLVAIIQNEPSDVVKERLSQLSPAALQNIAYAAPILARLCREAFDELPPESEPTNEA